MLIAQNSGVGGNVGFPDTCNTPSASGTTPITYPNYSTDATSINSAIKVLVGALPSLHMMSKAAMTNGMQAGVAHPLYMGMGGYSSGNIKIFVMGMPAESLGMVANGNNYNCASDATLIPSITITFYCRKPDGAHAERDAVNRWNRPVAPADIDALLHDLPAVSGERRADGTAVIRIPLFHGDTPRQLVNEVRRLESAADAPLTALQLDLRDNPGGELDAAMRTADLLLPAGTVLVGLRDADIPDLPARLLRARDGVRIHLPVTLRVNRGTASAAEAFTAALADNQRATVVGDTTFGKGATQRIHDGRWLTIGHIERADGRAIEGAGVAPTGAPEQLEPAV